MKKILYFFALLFSIVLSAQDGTLDTSFNIGTGTDKGVSSVAYQPDGKILLGGAFTTYNNVPKKYLARINSDGTLDTSFTLTNDYLVEEVNAVCVLPNGKILIGGNSIFRLNADGSYDTTFKRESLGWGDVRDIILQDDGKIIIVGDFTNAIRRLNSDGSFDTTFVINSKFATLDAYCVAIQSDNKILVGGDNILSYNPWIAPYIDPYMFRLNSDGTIDSSFKLDLPIMDKILDLKILPDGKIVTGGNFVASFNSRTYRYIARLNANGSVDPSFANTSIDGRGVNSITIQPDNKIVLGGDFYSLNDVGKMGIARVNSNGTLDQSFQSGSGVINADLKLVSISLVQPDGKLLVGGSFNIYNGVARNNIIRINNPSLSTIELLRNKELSIYPNPVKDILNIKTDEPISGYEIYSLDGRKLTTGNKVNDSKIDVSNLSKGNYIIKIKSKTKEQTTKFIKE